MSPRAPLVVYAVLSLAFSSRPPAGKEFLTPQEIERIQEAQEIDKRVKIYMDAAALRLKSAQARLNGIESEPGDPLEFFTAEDMLDGYYRILLSVMQNLDGASQKPDADRGKFVKALKTLKEGTEKAARELGVLKRMAEDKKLEKVWNLVNQAGDITGGAHEGAALGLSREPPEKSKRKGPAAE